jgi:predicted anti-sigma-YlaC factor YlaD
MTECTHEREVLDLVLSGRWPEHCDDATREHIDACEVCSDVVTIALAMEDTRETTAREASPPDATLVWWRAQLRAHEDAARKAARPIALVQGVALGIGIVGTVSVTRSAWPWLRTYFAGTGDSIAHAVSSAVASSSLFVATAPWLTLAIIGTVIATPIALYLAVGKD